MATTLATWTIDPVHSSVELSLDYMGAGDVPQFPHVLGLVRSRCYRCRLRERLYTPSDVRDSSK